MLENNIRNFYLTSDNRKDELSTMISGQIAPFTTDGHAVVSDTGTIDKLIGLFTAKGTWSDIDYQNNQMSGFDQVKHAERILLLAVMYEKPGSKYYRKRALSTVIHQAMQYWFDTRPVCVNWWYNEIGIPKLLGPAFILMKNELTQPEMAGALLVMSKSSFKQTGQNKVWQAGNILLKAVLIRDEKLAMRARDTLFSELHTSRHEGMQPDMSFHQHGPQQQMGNYGMAFLNSLTFWFRMLAGTPLAVDAGRSKVLQTFLTDGFNWLSWKGYFDVNSLGRQFFRNAQKDKSLSVAFATMDMMIIDPAHQHDYLSAIKTNYSNAEASARPLGTKHFWCSDFTVHRSAGWFSSTKMSSDRIQATETGNGENLRGYYIGSGTTFIEVDGNEYNDIFACWDWKKLPGVTAARNDKPLPRLDWKGYHNAGDFTGGLTDGEDGITAFKLNRDLLTANKAWFYIDGRMICLGSAIHSQLKNAAVYTTINQANLSGGVMYGDKDGNPLAPGATQTSNRIKWVFHHQVGYYFLKQDSIIISSKTQSGRWQDIELADNQPGLIKKDVFTIEIKHDSNLLSNSYAYVVLPAVKLAEIKNFKPGFEVIENDAQAQAIVKNDGSGLWLAAYRPTSIKVSKFPVIGVKQAGLYLIKKADGHYRLWVADPTQKLKQMTVTVKGKTTGITLPQGNEAGKTTSINFY